MGGFSLILAKFYIFVFVTIIFLIPNQYDPIFGSLVRSLAAGTELREEFLDSNGKFLLKWSPDFNKSRVTFSIMAETLGFVGFGISSNGRMEGANLMMGGVHTNGTSYFAEYLSYGNEMPKLDPNQDWNILEASENGTHTFLTFDRPFDTCDIKDLQIGNDTSNLIWAIGESDNIVYHRTNRGSYSLNLLDPPTLPLESSGLSKWTIANDFVMPSDETTYWCTMHLGPVLPTKHHAIAFEPYLPTEEARIHTHHFIVHECQDTPAAIEAIEALKNSPGDHCYKAGNGLSALYQCQSFLLVWATGGRRAVFPENVGFPISEYNIHKYYMLQVHYNNPERLEGIKFEAGANIFYTPKLREFEATTLTVAHSVLNTHIVPPGAKSFITVGHCSSECTRDNFPSSGINIFNIMLHSHIAGRKMKLRHFRNGQELPWIAYDNNYNFNYQQNRPLREEIKVLPGDQLAVECDYETTGLQNVTLGGFATEEEMCQAFILYYPRVNTRLCGSHYPYLESLNDFGIEKMEFVHGSTNLRVTAPEKLIGKRFNDVLNEIDWTPEIIADFQAKSRFTPHSSRCDQITETQKSGGPIMSNLTVTYMKVKTEYALHPTCAAAPVAA